MLKTHIPLISNLTLNNNLKEQKHKKQGTYTNMLYTHNQTYPITTDFLGGRIWEIFLFFLPFGVFSFFKSMNMYCLYVSKSEKKVWVYIQKPSHTKAVRSLYIPF